MNDRQWQDLIVKAVAHKDEDLLSSLAHQLANCEIANSILRNKGYGKQGQTIDATVKLVPNARES